MNLISALGSCDTHTRSFPLKLSHDPRDVTALAIPNTYHIGDNVLHKFRNVHQLKRNEENAGLQVSLSEALKETGEKGGWRSMTNYFILRAALESVINNGKGC